MPCLIILLVRDAEFLENTPTFIRRELGTVIRKLIHSNFQNRTATFIVERLVLIYDIFLLKKHYF